MSQRKAKAPSGKRDRNAELDQRSVLGVIRSRGRRGMTVGQLVNHLVAGGDRGRSEVRHELRPLLRSMERDGQLVLGRGKRYFAVEHTDLVTGRIRIRSGVGILASEEDEGRPVRIPPSGLRGAMDGDRVVARLEKPRQRAREEDQREGTITRILERRRDVVVGRWEVLGGRPHVKPLDRRVGVSIFPTGSDVKGEPEEGELVVASVESVAAKSRHGRGRLLERLGMVGEPGVEELAVLRALAIPDRFDDAVEAEAEAVSAKIRPEDVEGRWDLRGSPAITIDPDTARDFDDAVDARRGRGGRIVVQVHIADVSHYVRPGTAMDEAAQERGTSVYLPRRAIPMLPERLSSDICSLRPEVDRMAFSVRFEVDPDGGMSKPEASPSVIRSRRRCTYSEAAAWLELPAEQWPAETGPFAESLQLAAEAARRLGEARRKRGSLDFDLAEPEVLLGDDGEVVGVRPRTRTTAHRLVEELMVAANQCVARLLDDAGQPTLHRVHEDPAAEAVQELAAALAEWGIKLDSKEGELPVTRLQRILERVAGRPEERVVSMLVLRTLARARYAPEALGHYALATEYYVHFTSPIRRYPDLVCHRMLRLLLERGRPVKGDERGRIEGELERLGASCSAAEERADEAERQAVQYATVLYLQERVGEVFDGVVTGVMPFGIFVQLVEVFTDCLVHVTELPDDYYLHDRATHRLIGERTRRVFRLGDKVKVRLERVDLGTMNVEVKLVETERSGKKREGGGRRGRQGRKKARR